MIEVTIAFVGGVIVTRPRVRRVCRVCGRMVWRGAVTLGYMRYPGAFVDWEAQRYEQWLKDHSVR